jgi:hypothetical protein
MRTENSNRFTDSELELSLPPAQKESSNKNSSGTFPLLNSKVGPLDCKTAKLNMDNDIFGDNSIWPNFSPPNAISSFTESISEPAPTSEYNTKRVRFYIGTPVSEPTSSSEYNTKRVRFSNETPVSEPTSSSEDNTKRVRFNNEIQVFQIPNLDEVNTMEQPKEKKLRRVNNQINKHEVIK